jgi:hypothetical protein
MKVWVLYKESETDDINNPYVEDVEIFFDKSQAEQIADFMNSLLSNYDQHYNGWSVGTARTVRGKYK